MADQIVPSKAMREAFDALYRGEGTNMGVDGVDMQVIPWQLDGPQPLVVELVDGGEVVSPVLECGCGLGDNALFMAERGHTVTALDASATVIEKDRAKAAARGLTVNFTVSDATTLEGISGAFATVLDSGLLHCFTDAERRDYLAALSRVCRPGARLHILCFPEGATDALTHMRGHLDEASLRRDLSEHWQVERMEIRRYTVGLSREEWRTQMPPASAKIAPDLDSADSVDEQGRVLVPTWQITARLK